MKISIVTVTYNSERFLEQCIQSLRAQTHSNIEHIIVDGKSTDSTLEIVNSLKLNSSTVISEEDDGIYDAMNKGIDLSTGDIVGILNSDDYYGNENVLEKVNKIFIDD